MDLEQLKEYMEEQFVEDYKGIHEFMVNVNDTLEKIGIAEKYETYNEFCIDIQSNIFAILENMKEITVSPAIVITALNNMVKYKILKDLSYENKIKEYFQDPDSVLDDINQLKIKSIENGIEITNRVSYSEYVSNSGKTTNQ